jgi:hypothetical protein
MNYAHLFEEHIRVQQQAIRSSGIWAALLFTLGAALILFSLLGNLDKALIPEMIKLSGGFVMSGLSFYQIKDVIQRRERIASYSYLKRSFEETEKLPLEEQTKLVEIAIETLRETMRR